MSRLPANAKLGAIFAVALTLALLAQVNLQLTFRLVEHPVSLGAANLEADPDVVRGWYSFLIDQGTYLQMVRTEIVDLVWATLLGLTILSLYRFIAGLLRNVHPRISRVLVRLAPFATAGPAFDLIENAFSLGMLTDPFGIPDWWASAHTLASSIRLALSVASAIVGLTLTIAALISVRRARKAPCAAKDLPSP